MRRFWIIIGGGLLVLILVAGLVVRERWGVIPRPTPPTIAEQAARAAYQQATLNREVAEYAIKEFQEGTVQQSTTDAGIALEQADRARDRLRWSFPGDHPRDAMPTLRWNGDLPTLRWQGDHAARETASQPSQDRVLQSLRDDLLKARADEALKQAQYLRERARRG